ncbi:hypothetical protein [Pseudomonas sp. H3(2019)]|uniref:phosphoribosyltransferase-like protein n=1 Tax=Pseudomonas sp. H3(2019) TaxID=2598724 RepID=UPI00118F3EE1|nr:hypothetical protein [Pseudomonas sp. H3(2019)]TVT85214.1 hypothetical protein FPT12_06195 [Pseudomonas sp. H3(2019)]
MELKDILKRKIEVLSQQAWDSRLTWPDVEAWLENFNGQFKDESNEKLHALHLLSQVNYFGLDLLREMLKCVYQTLYRHPITSQIRRANNDTLDPGIIEPLFLEERLKTRFVGVGNPSESGPHLLYYFRQINNLGKDLFIDSGDIFKLSRDNQGQIQISQHDKSIKRYVFIDDLLGSGSQIEQYLSHKLKEIRRFPGVECHYYALFATTKGLETARKPEYFGDNVSCVFELDETFKCFSPNARAFANLPSGLDKQSAQDIAAGYGAKLLPSDHVLGYKNGQLLLSFLHNTPDNSLPIMWFDNPLSTSWVPIFKRFDKKYGV